MPELWEHCNTKSRVILAYLYYRDNGHYPDWYLIMKGEKQAPKELVTMSKDLEEERLEELQRLMRRPPSRSRD